MKMKVDGLQDKHRVGTRLLRLPTLPAQFVIKHVIQVFYGWGVICTYIILDTRTYHVFK